MYKFTIGKLTPGQLADALKGQLQIEVTPEIIKGIMADEDAVRLGLLTKGEDSNLAVRMDTLEATVKAMVEGLPGIIEAAVKASMPKFEATELKLPDGLASFNPVEFNKQMTEVVEKAGQAVAVAEAVKAEVTAKLTAQPAHGNLTPEMQSVLQTMVSAREGNDDPFARNVALYSK